MWNIAVESLDYVLIYGEVGLSISPKPTVHALMAK